MSVFVVVSEDFTNRGNNGWEFDGLYRNNGGEYRIEIRADAYERQSWAKLEVWGVGGWNFFTSLPVEDWWHTCPSYTKKHLEAADRAPFYEIRMELMTRFAHAHWNSLEEVVVDYADQTSREVHVPA